MGGNAEHANYAPCSLGDLDAAAMDYWALGHVHKRRLLREGTPCVAYSGNTQGRSPKPAETGAKGALVVQASGTGIEEVRFAPVDVVRFVTCAVDVGDAADVAALQAAIRDGVDDCAREHEGRSLLVRVVLEGRGAVSADVRREGALPDLCRELRDGYDGREPFVWIASVKDASRGALDLDEIRRRGDFSAELVGLADRLAGDQDAAAAFVERAAELLARPGQVERALRELEAGLPGTATAEATGEVLSEALLLALDGLEREAGA